MDRFEAMTTLLAVVDAGSLSAASRRLRVPLATVSRRLSQLEEELNVRLLLRGTRKLTLTETGVAYVEACRQILEQLAEAERVASGEYVAPQGELTVSAPEVMGRLHLVPVVVEFLHAYPDVRVRLQFTDRNTNLVEEHVDLALRVGALPDSSMIATPVGLLRQILCASPTYLDARGVPREPADLESHDLIAYEGFWTGDYWALATSSLPQASRPARLVVNSSEAAINAAVAGGGIARALSYQVDALVQSGALVTFLETYEPAGMPVHLVFPRHRRTPKKLRAFLDFTVDRLRSRLGYIGAR